MQMIQILITGGTFDKSYNHLKGDLYFKKTHIPEMLERSKSRLNVNVKTLMMIDSLEMTQKDIQLIINECINSKSKRIIITHGTDTMVRTASKIAKEVKDKTIVLTGAMIPYAFGSSSDGFFNLGSALSFVQVLKKGVYVAMNGQYFKHDNVKKNIEKGFFEKNNF